VDALAAMVVLAIAAFGMGCYGYRPHSEEAAYHILFGTHTSNVFSVFLCCLWDIVFFLKVSTLSIADWRFLPKGVRILTDKSIWI